jgi:hypothetical protein
MMRYRQFTIFTLAVAGLVLLAGCASEALRPGCLPLARDGQVCLLKPRALPHVEARHIVTVLHDDKKSVFMGDLEIDNNALRLSAASLFGTGLYSIVWDGASIDVKPPRAHKRAARLVTMVELALAAPARLRPRLVNLKLMVRHGSNGEVRTLYEHGHLIARIEKSAGPLNQARMSIKIPRADVRVTMRPVHGASQR